MTEQDQQQRPSGSPWDVAIKERLSSVGSMPVDISGLEARISGEIPRPAHMNLSPAKRSGCLGGVLLLVGLFITTIGLSNLAATAMERLSSNRGLAPITGRHS
jgi:hypothetical protein